MLPLLLVGFSLVSTGWGAKKGVDGLIARGQAKERETEAQQHVAEARSRLEEARASTEAHLSALAATRADAARVLIEKALPQLSRIAHLEDEGRVHGAFASTDYSLPDVSIPEREGMVLSVGAAALLGRAAGAGLSSAAIGVASSVGVASTGAAISGLQGAAATNATLAYLGGGPIAAGGAGMAGGAAVLSGVALGPAVLLAGLKFASRSEERLVVAERCRAEAVVAAAQVQSSIVRLNGISTRADEADVVTVALADRTTAASAVLKDRLDELDIDGVVEFRTLPDRTRASANLLTRLTIELDAVIAVDLYDEIGDVVRADGDAVDQARAAATWRA